MPATDRPPFERAPRGVKAHWVRPKLVAEVAFTGNGNDVTQLGQGHGAAFAEVGNLTIANCYRQHKGIQVMLLLLALR